MKLKEIKQRAEDISKTAPNGDESLVLVNGTPLDMHFNNVEHGDDSWVDISFSSNIGQIIKNSKPMPGEFAKLVNDNFWYLVDDDYVHDDDNYKVTVGGDGARVEFKVHSADTNSEVLIEVDDFAGVINVNEKVRLSYRVNKNEKRTISVIESSVEVLDMWRHGVKLKFKLIHN